jgi:signal transduction histidine kinase
MQDESEKTTTLLHAAIRSLRDLLFSRSLGPEPPPELMELEGFGQLHSTLIEIRSALMAFAGGNLDFEVKKKGYLPSSIKQFQASLRHLTWQTKMIATGDFSQRVDFMGDFSESFNSMVRELEQKKRLESVNRQLQKSESLGRMAGAIAHHFNNQLGAVMGNLEMAMLDLPSDSSDSEEVHKSLSAAMKASLRAATVSGLMLTYLGETPCRHEPTDLSATCLKALPLLEAATPKNLVLHHDFPLPGFTVTANADQVQQVLTNLFTNACEAIGNDPGEVHIALQRVSPLDIALAHRFPIDWQPDEGGGYACLEVKDTGCGIADGAIEELFEPFFSSKFTGRGLGLPVVLGIVRTHGGAVTVESVPNRGTTFRVHFPIPAGEEASVSPSP